MRERRSRIKPPARVLVTGASSGIGAALARHYARRGVTLVLIGRDRARLDAVAAECVLRGAAAETCPLDLADGAAALDAVAALDDAHRFDLAILAAGLGDMRRAGEPTEDPARALAVASVNFGSTAALATLLARRMAGRGGGALALLGSVAGFFPLPMAPTYSGSKAGLARFARALRLGVAAHGVRVTLASPGFVDTPMSRRVHAPKPFLMGAEAAAGRIAGAVARGRAHVILPRPFVLAAVVASLAPAPLQHAVLRRLRADQAPLFDGGAR